MNGLIGDDFCLLTDGGTQLTMNDQGDEDFSQSTDRGT